jgi:nicotinamidase-related amidase
MSEHAARSLVVAVHYQNENCHPAGRIKVGVGGDEASRVAMLAAAGRLIEGARRCGVLVIHVRLAVRSDYQDVIQNAPPFRQWIEQGAWRGGSWGAEFYDGLGPAAGELVVTHIRNNPFVGSPLATLLALRRPRRLICAGVSTAYAVESTVRHAADLGYEVVVAADACSTATRAPPRGVARGDGAACDHQRGRRDRPELRRQPTLSCAAEPQGSGHCHAISATNLCSMAWVRSGSSRASITKAPTPVCTCFRK